MKETINDKITNLMKDKKLTYRDLEKITGIPRSALQRYASGSTESIPISRVKLLADALGVTPSYLSGWEDNADDIYGDHKANLEHFSNDPELLAFYKDMHESENLKLLFDTGRELTPDELEKVLRYMKMVMDGSL